MKLGKMPKFVREINKKLDDMNEEQKKQGIPETKTRIENVYRKLGLDLK